MKKHNILLGVDSTFATPALTRPIELGRGYCDALGHQIHRRP